VLLQSEGGIWAAADARVFALLAEPNRTERRLLAANRTMSQAVARVAALRRWHAAAADRENARAARAVEQEMREMEWAWGRTLRIKMPRQSARAARASAKRALLAETPHARKPRAYQKPLRDRRGRVAVFVRIRYVGFKSKNWRPALAADHVIYILREYALEQPDAPLLSNMGDTTEEVAACWRAIEEVEQGYRANAKVQFRMILNLPHGLTPEQRHELVKAFCERTFGRLGLPWVAAVHTPDPEGDQRNFHAHICFSTRPCARIGDHEWAIAQEKVNGLDGKEGLKRLRALAAAHLNLACFAAGLAIRFTHQTYKERGLDAERQEHVGPAAMAAFRKGETVAVVERNAARVECNEAAVACQHAAQEAQAQETLADLLERRVALDERRADAARRIRAVIALRARAEAATEKRAPASSTAPEARRNRAAALAATARRLLQAQTLQVRRDRSATLDAVRARVATARQRLARTPSRAVNGALSARAAMLAAMAQRAVRRLHLDGVRAGAATRRRTAAALARRADDGLLVRASILARHAAAHESFSERLERIRAAADDHGRREAERREQERRAAGRRRDDEARRQAAAQAASDLARALRADAPKKERDAARQPATPPPGAIAAPAPAADVAAIESLRRFDPWVTVPADAETLEISNRALAFLGKDRAWLERADVQHALRAMADDQLERLLPMLDDLAWSGGRLALRRDDPTLHRTLESWASEPAFVQFAVKAALHLDAAEPRRSAEPQPQRADPPPGPAQPSPEPDNPAPRRPAPPWIGRGDLGRGG
jgi:hypothetical protein